MYQAVIFDMNGVIVNDERIHQEAWKRMLSAHHIFLTEEDFSHTVFGRTEKETLNRVFQRELTSQEIENYSNERVNIAIELFRPNIQPTPGLIEFIQSLRSIDIKLGIATSSRNRYKDFILHSLGLTHFFDAIVTAEDIEKGKPDPEIYLKTAEKLHINPSACLVFEDTKSGIQAGKDAGMKVVGITTTHTQEFLQSADFIIDSFEGIGLTDFVIR